VTSVMKLTLSFTQRRQSCNTLHINRTRSCFGSCLGPASGGAYCTLIRRMKRKKNVTKVRSPFSQFYISSRKPPFKSEECCKGLDGQVREGATTGLVLGLSDSHIRHQALITTRLSNFEKSAKNRKISKNQPKIEN